MVDKQTRTTYLLDHKGLYWTGKFFSCRNGLGKMTENMVINVCLTRTCEQCKAMGERNKKFMEKFK